MVEKSDFKRIYGGVIPPYSPHSLVHFVSSLNNVMVADVLSLSSCGLDWNLLFVRDLYDWEVDLVAILVDNLNEVYISRDDKD